MKVIAKTTTNTVILEVSLPELALIAKTLPEEWEKEFRKGIESLGLNERWKNMMYRLIDGVAYRGEHLYLFTHSNSTKVIAFDEWVKQTEKHKKLSQVRGIGKVGRDIIITAIENYKRNRNAKD